MSFFKELSCQASAQSFFLNTLPRGPRVLGDPARKGLWECTLLFWFWFAAKRRAEVFETSTTELSMPSTGEFTTASLMTFIFLGIIRGTFSVVIHFAVDSFQSPSLVFLLRTPGTIFLYVGFILYLSFKNDEQRRIFSSNFCAFRNYWKSAVMGFVQLVAPYLLFIYGLKILNPTVGGVYMAAAPWFTVLLERLPFIQVRTYQDILARFRAVGENATSSLLFTPEVNKRFLALGICFLRLWYFEGIKLEMGGKYLHPQSDTR